MGKDSSVGIPSVCGPVSSTVIPADPSCDLHLRGLPEGIIAICCLLYKMGQDFLDIQQGKKREIQVTKGSRFNVPLV